MSILISPGFRARKWTRDEYRRMTEIGLFEGKRVELIKGEIVERMAAMRGPHAVALEKVGDALSQAFRGRFSIRNQTPILLPNDSEPEPDFTVARGTSDDYIQNHPTPADIVLVIEVADSTLTTDRRFKSALYAEANLPEYWLLNVDERQLEVFRAPQVDAASPFGWSYATRLVVRETDSVAPLFAPQTSFSVAEMLPRASSE